MFTLDPHAARSCLLKVHHKFHPGLVRPEVAAGPPPSHSVGFRSTVRAKLLAGRVPVSDLTKLRSEPSSTQETACLEAMAAGAPVILGGLLPRDWSAHRAGRPELLVADPAGGYLPGIIRAHRVVDPRGDSRSYRYSGLEELGRPIETTGWGYRWNQRAANSLHLAHLWRLLEATGQQSQRGPTGLVIGADQFDGEWRASWLNLSEATLHGTADQLSSPAERDQPLPLVSALERYDYEFAVRVELAELASAAEPDDPPLLQPVVTYQCGHCVWWELCRAQLDDDDLSLRISKSRLDASEVSAMRAMGIHTVHDLAAADLEKVVETLLGVADRPGTEDRLRLAHRRAGMLSRGVALERLTAGPIQVPRAELEVDIDIETGGDDRVYLWGFRVSGPGREPSYVEFSEFSELSPEDELELACKAMSWLRDLVTGSDALVYHYSDYEVTRLRRLAESGEAEVLSWAISYAAKSFVDLFELVREHFFGAEGLGLKVVANAGAGFSWRDPSPGGLNSMSWFADAIHGETQEIRAQARLRVLEYNEDDVTATARLREWLCQQQ